MSVRTHPVVTALAVLLALGVGLPASAAEPEPAQPAPINVAISTTAIGGPTGVGLVSASEGGSAIQVLITGASDGTNVAIHGQACADVDGSVLAGLVGQLAATGQAQATIPIPLATLADGGHVIALHPGFDFTKVVACGPIPQVAVGPGPQPQPPVDDTCAGVPAWVTSAKARLTRLDELEALANDVQFQGVGAYNIQLSANIGETRVMVAQARAETPPALAADAHQAFIDMLDAFIDGASQLQVAMGGQDRVAVQRALAALNGAYQKQSAVRTTVAELGVRCPG